MKCNCQLYQHTSVCVCLWAFLLSSSKCVSVPSLPGTEHTRRAFRNVVHLFTRLRCPPISFYNQKNMHVNLNQDDKQQPIAIRLSDKWLAPNPAKLANPGICNLPESLSFYSSFSEEEEDFIIVRILTLGNTKCRYKLGLWNTQHHHRAHCHYTKNRDAHKHMGQ